MGVFPPRSRKIGEFFAEYRRYGAELFQMVLPATGIHGDSHYYRNSVEQQTDPCYGYDRRRLVVDNILLDLLPAFTDIDNLENKNLSFHMEGGFSDFNNVSAFCNKLVVI